MPEKASIERLPHDRRLELLLHALIDYALYLLNPDGYIVSWNPGARRLKGYEDSEIIGQHFSRFFTLDDQRRGLPQIAPTREGRFEKGRLAPTQRRLEILGACRH